MAPLKHHRLAGISKYQTHQSTFEMKLKITITGPKVHDVGYRRFLMSNAVDLGLRGFHARNRTGEKEQEVLATIEGDGDLIEDFKKLVESGRPGGAQVSSIAFEDYAGDVMPIGEYAQAYSALQQSKALSILLEIRDNTRAILGDTKSLAETTRAIKDDIDNISLWPKI